MPIPRGKNSPAETYSILKSSSIAIPSMLLTRNCSPALIILIKERLLLSNKTKTQELTENMA